MAVKRKTIEDVVQFAVRHALRLQILIVLSEGHYTCSEIAEIISAKKNNVANHVGELLDAGSIEIAKEERRGNLTTYYYKGIHIPHHSKEEYEALTPQQRQVSVGLAIQGALAEVMAALGAGKLADPRTVVSWDVHHLDRRGRDDFEAEMKRSLERVAEIDAESADRVARSGEGATPMIHTAFGYERVYEPQTFSSSRFRERGSEVD